MVLVRISILLGTVGQVTGMTSFTAAGWAVIMWKEITMARDQMIAAMME